MLSMSPGCTSGREAVGICRSLGLVGSLAVGHWEHDFEGSSGSQTLPLCLMVCLAPPTIVCCQTQAQHSESDQSETRTFQTKAKLTLKKK